MEKESLSETLFESSQKQDSYEAYEDHKG